MGAANFCKGQKAMSGIRPQHSLIIMSPDGRPQKSLQCPQFIDPQYWRYPRFSLEYYENSWIILRSSDVPANLVRGFLQSHPGIPPSLQENKGISRGETDHIFRNVIWKSVNNNNYSFIILLFPWEEATGPVLLQLLTGAISFRLTFRLKHVIIQSKI